MLRKADYALVSQGTLSDEDTSSFVGGSVLPGAFVLLYTDDGRALTYNYNPVVLPSVKLSSSSSSLSLLPPVAPLPPSARAESAAISAAISRGSSAPHARSTPATYARTMRASAGVSGALSVRRRALTPPPSEPPTGRPCEEKSASFASGKCCAR